jgi:uncharacterized protein (TIGR03000 family)
MLRNRRASSTVLILGAAVLWHASASDGTAQTGRPGAARGVPAVQQPRTAPAGSRGTPVTPARGGSYGGNFGGTRAQVVYGGSVYGGFGLLPGSVVNSFPNGYGYYQGYGADRTAIDPCAAYAALARCNSPGFGSCWFSNSANPYCVKNSSVSNSSNPYAYYFNNATATVAANASVRAPSRRVVISDDTESPEEQRSADDRAHIQLLVPENAEVWFQGEKTTLTGSRREFVSPLLTPGGVYTYELRVRWNDNGTVVERSRTLDVRANETITVDFRR